MGQRDVETVAVYEDGNLKECRFGYESGTDISAGFKGDMSLVAANNACTIVVSGTGGESAASAGHEATVDAITEAGKAAKDIISGVSEGVVNGIRRGFAP